MADVSPYGNPGTAEPNAKPAGIDTPGSPLNVTATTVPAADVPEGEVKMLHPLRLGWPRGKRAYPAQHSGQIIERK